MIKLLFAATILFIVACSDDSSNTAEAYQKNNTVLNCNYTFECKHASEIIFDNNIIYTNNDSIVFTDLFQNTLAMQSIDGIWALSSFMQRMKENCTKTYSLNDTLLTEAQVIEQEQKQISFLTSVDDELIFMSYNDYEHIFSLVQRTYQQCNQDPICTATYYDILKSDSAIASDVINFQKLRNLILEDESICKLSNTECNREKIVTD